jgi:arylsulfatase A-like enzyme
MLGYGEVAVNYAAELPQVLRGAGYYTAGIGKMHWTPQRSEHGFHQTILDESGRVESPDFRSDYRSWFWTESPLGDPDSTGLDWNGYEARPFQPAEHLHPTAWIGETAVRFLRDYQRPEPFFLKVSFERPHSPYDPPARWFDRYSTALPPAVTGHWAEKFKARSSNRRDIWHGDLGRDAVQAARQGYYGSVSFVDEQLGLILDALQRRGWRENTLVLYLSDHGDMLGDHNLWRKTYPYESSSKVPLLIRWPAGLGERSRSLRIYNPVELRDVLPTLADAAQAFIPRQVEGESLLKLARYPDAEWRGWIDLEHDIAYSPENHWNALTDGKSKYIFNAFDGHEEFFDLSTDPGERNNLAADPSSQPEVKRWRERLIQHLAVRGVTWVHKGQLQLRKESVLYSPNYPGKI